METKYAGLIIDMQEDFLRNMEPEECECILDATRVTLQFLRSASIPLIVVEYEGYGPTEAGIREVLHGSRHRYVLKQRNDAFWNTSLGTLLSDMRSTSLILMGVSTSHCVRETFMSAVARGYKVATSYDVIGDTRDTPPNITGYVHSLLGVHGELYPDAHALRASLHIRAT